MSDDERLCKGLEKLGPPVAPGLDTTADDEYFVYGYERSGTLWGDDAPSLEQRMWTVVYVAPNGANRLEMRKAISNLIFNLFGSWPTEEPENTASGQRFFYEFETVGGL